MASLHRADICTFSQPLLQIISNPAHRKTCRHSYRSWHQSPGGALPTCCLHAYVTNTRDTTQQSETLINLGLPLTITAASHLYHLCSTYRVL